MMTKSAKRRLAVSDIFFASECVVSTALWRMQAGAPPGDPSVTAF
jgi:hypothetical protein